MSALLDSSSLHASLATIVGDKHVSADEARRTYFSRDLSYLPHATAALVVSPGSVEQLQTAVRAATTAGYAVIPRGGGMSYTQAYSPDRESTVMVDMQRLDKIVEINTEDMYVIVECGCTWKKLLEALRPKGVRTPYYGPLSGMYATVGGAIAQNSLFLGSGDNHTVAESVLGLEVVMADGTLLRTGSWAHKLSNPFYRHFGPDITGLFTADTGAFGFKARAVLRLLLQPETTLTMSFAFETLAEMLAVQVEMSRLRLAAECYGFDPYYNATFEDKGFSFSQGVSALKQIVKSDKSMLSGIVKAARVARGGKRVLRGVNYSLHMTFEGQVPGIAAAKLRSAHEICSRHGGVEINNSLPTVFNTTPFDGVGAVLLGGDGELWLPVHAFMPLSRVQQVGAAVERFLADNKQLMDEHSIRSSYLTCYSGTEFVIEPSFYWYDEIQQFRLDRIEPAMREKWKDRKPQPEKRRVALHLRDQLRDLFDANGCCHLQIGRYYPYRDMMNNDALWTLLQSVKNQLDPACLVNPGSLGFHDGGDTSHG